MYFVSVEGMKGDFSSFYQSYAHKIYRFVFYRVGRQRDRAEDLTQEIFLKAYEAFSRYNPEVSRTAWLYTIARNHLINAHQREKATSDLDEVDQHASLSVDGRAQAQLSEDQRRLLSAIDRLSDEDATLVRMKYLEGWSFDELAQMLEKNAGALRVQASRALKKLARDLT